LIGRRLVPRYGQFRLMQAGIASGTLNTTQQFAGSAGIAAIGAVFFASLGTRPGLWIGLALTLVIAVLRTILAPRRAGTPASASPAEGTTAASASVTKPVADSQALE
jgi:hypothetical protein